MPPPPPTTDDLVERAHAFLRAHTTGELRFGEDVRDIKYIIDPLHGRLIAPVMVAMLTCFDTVLFIPDMGEESMQVQVTLAEIDDEGDDGVSADRWRIYHGDPPDVRWALMSIDAVRFEGAVIDGEALMRSNPLGPVEADILKHFNREDKETLRTLARNIAEVEIEDPVLVGVDANGLDIRGRFDVHRVTFPQRLTEAKDIHDFYAMLNEKSEGSASE